MRAPDYVEPIVGWRVWLVVESEAGIRLCSPVYGTIWHPHQEAVATCRHTQARGTWENGGDDGPEPCGCGIYASRTADRAARYIARFGRRRGGVLHHVFGRVSLWGRVVEADMGWRGTRAYPETIYVPGRRRWPTPFSLMLPPVEEIAGALKVYGVPVEIVDCRPTSAEVRALLRRLPSLAPRPAQG